ncbi:histidinol-phosphate transaminase [Lentibacillus cibarius]|uniref:Histidinol-phosphate aminotransferase n=1 Tax=Lentibacillus cibarius TaxID=2583219 RepID=A0A5S3QJS2_9BACI|nr:histidinol-phosphate transaminase [Lentibacillus cibarius]TMN20676.1 histidinol-phosphate transaminase [Lentibacillus cibarius]
MKNKKVLDGMTPYKPGKQIEEVKEEYGLSRIVKLASNENPFGHSEQVNTTISHMLEHHIYPDGYATELRRTAAANLNVKEEQLIFGSGTDEIIQIIGRAFLYPGVNTVMAAPTFPQYKHSARIEGAEVKEIPTVNGCHDLSGILSAIDDRTSVVWLCSPNNPTGCVISKDDFYAFMDKCPENVLVVLDEAYYEYVSAEWNLRVLDHLEQYENLMVLRTFSKAYGLAGLRVGYGIASETLIRKLDVVRGPFNVSTIAQKAALKAMEDDAFLEQAITRIHAIKQSFEHFLDSIGWHYFESHTNFLLISTPISGERVFQYLLENGFIVKAGEGLGAPNTIRVTIGTETDMQQLQKVLYQLHLKLDKEQSM